MKLVLSIDGGGIRGIIPAMVLNELESRTGCHTGRAFDLIAGTSTGGILTLCLTRRAADLWPMYTAKDLVRFYLEQGPKIFSRSWFRTAVSVDGVLDEKYPNKNLQEALRQRLGSSLVSEATTEVLVSAYDLKGRQPLFFKRSSARKSMSEEFLCWQAALATAAAPTYFVPTVAQSREPKDIPLVDGGVFATNVSMCAYAEAKSLWPDEEIFVVSLGCGEMVGPYDWKKLCTGQIGWVQPLLDIMFQGSSVTVDYQMRHLTKNYRRVQTQFKYSSDAMDDASEKNLANLQRDAAEMIAANKPTLDEVVQLICNRAPWRPN